MLGVILSLLGIGMLIALMFNMAVLALPLFAAVAAGRFAHDTGAGVLGAIAVGFVAAAAALGAGQAILVMARSMFVRLAMALAFTAPAAFAGYHLAIGLSHIGGAQEVWQQIFACIGGIAVGAAALMRLATPSFHRLHSPALPDCAGAMIMAIGILTVTMSSSPPEPTI